MLLRLPLAFVATSVVWGGVAATAQSPRAVSAREAGAQAAILRNVDDEPVLTIHYPWKVYRKPSVEIRLVTGEEEGKAKVRPLFFRAEFVTGEVTVAALECLRAAAGVGGSKSMERFGVDFTIVGQRNSLEKPAVTMVHLIPDRKPTPEQSLRDIPPAGTAAAYCFLDNWAVNDRLLELDLSKAAFSQRGKLYVWFLRNDKVIWQTTLRWPGHAPTDVPAKP